MTTQEFIYKNVGITQREKFCSSVFVNNGIVYSYGYHYPLATIINGYGFVNTSGYSVTTAKHINWARQALIQRLGSHNVFDVELKGKDFDAKNILLSLADQVTDLMFKIEKKKRRDTSVYRNLIYQRDTSNKALNTARTLV